MITTGDMERHIRRMRHEYARRRAAVTAAFADGQAGRLLGDQAGLHVVLHTHQDATVAATARRHGVATGTLTRFHATPVTGNGLVIGYGGAPLTQVARGCHILRNILADTTGRAPDVALCGLTCRAAPARIAGRGLAWPCACGRWLPVWLPGIS